MPGSPLRFGYEYQRVFAATACPIDTHTTFTPHSRHITFTCITSTRTASIHTASTHNTTLTRTTHITPPSLAPHTSCLETETGDFAWQLDFGLSKSMGGNEKTLASDPTKCILTCLVFSLHGNWALCLSLAKALMMPKP